MRLGIYSDFSYRRDGDALWAQLPVSVFLSGLARHMDSVTLLGRLDEERGRWNFRIPDGVELEPLPYYASLADMGAVTRASAESLRRYWRFLGRVDTVLLLGPHPLGIAFALLAALRRKRVFLLVRQDLPEYTRNRRPGRRALHLAADTLERAWRLLGRRFGVVVVGPALARNYAHARRLLPIAISLISERDIAPPELAAAKDYSGDLVALSVGRLDAEKNPLLLADVLARLGPRWRLAVVGSGPMEDDLRARIEELGLSERVELLGYVNDHSRLMELYRSSHALLHCSWTEGVPQVLFEAFSARLPVVATAVGGVADAAGDAALLVEPGDAEAPAQQLERLAAEPELRARLIEAGVAKARTNSFEASTGRVADFLSDGAR